VSTFGQCPHCPVGRGKMRLYGTGVCAYHLTHPAAKKPRDVVKFEHDEPVVLTAAQEKKALNDFYHQQVARRPPVCEETGCTCRLVATESWRLKAMVAHIVPKRHFRSVMVHPENRLFLCKQHHDAYDDNWAKAVTLGCWPLALERFQKFMHLIKDTELRHLPVPLRELTNR